MARHLSFAAVFLAACASPSRATDPDRRQESRAFDDPRATAVPARPEQDARRANVKGPVLGTPAAPATVSDPEQASTCEHPGAAEILASGAAPPSTGEPSPDSAREAPESAWKYYRERYDANGDGSITRAEYTRSENGFANLDANGDSVVSQADFAKRWEGVRRPGGKEGGFFVEGGPRLGRPAPDLRLSTTTGEEIDLARFRGKKPVALVFGSFT